LVISKNEMMNEIVSILGLVKPNQCAVTETSIHLYLFYSIIHIPVSHDTNQNYIYTL
jgi:hypothetical protein